MARNNSTRLTDELYSYMLGHNPPLDPVQRMLVEVTHTELPLVAGKQVAQEQGPLLAFLVRLTGARRIVEVGTFTGLSALSMAQALPAGGTLLTCDISEEWTERARTAWAKAGVADRIDLRIGDARQTLESLPQEQAFDMAFIDADKINYIAYWEALVPRIRQGGLLVVDNVFFHGEVVHPEAEGHAAAIKEFNDHVRQDQRVEAVMLAVADGLTLARRK
ncbi:O-methyltransferase [Streptomyces sulfonofaciens]|uniref:O-methyltransferase n=1 Tax=Streptomyces sulfonofaciens TaxID=68272 RepID=A0A919L481_9ACTN|nr:O-methyltransferase [Streptomyces sulfonofaciens]GHH84355.1 O-methyltransferase [Streptomyces sulfonofaciens]